VFTDSILGRMHIGVLYNDGVIASGVLAPTYTLTAGTLPVGLALNATTGAITGTPTVGGAFSFTVTATNIDGSVALPLSGTVFVPRCSPTRSSANRHHHRVRRRRHRQRHRSAHYTVGAGLPAGLSLNATTGAITGTATTGGAYNFTSLPRTRRRRIGGIHGFVFSPPVFTGLDRRSHRYDEQPH